MSEIWFRLLLVAGALAIVVVVAMFLRRPPPSREAVEGTGLGPGVYLFSSRTCADCLVAREQLTERLGETGFVEIEWEEDPGRFSRVGIEVVPCTVVVTEDGMATRLPGLPDRGLETLNP
jgi:hypothetical protein